MDASSANNGISLSHISDVSQKQSKSIINNHGVKSFQGRPVSQVPITRFTTTKSSKTITKGLDQYKISVIEEPIIELNQDNSSKHNEYTLPPIELNSAGKNNSQSSIKQSVIKNSQDSNKIQEKKEVFLDTESDFKSKLYKMRNKVNGVSIKDSPIAEMKLPLITRANTKNAKTEVKSFSEKLSSYGFKSRRKLVNNKLKKPRSMNLKVRLSKEVVSAQVIAKHKEKHLNRIRHSTIQPKNVGDEKRLYCEDGRFFSVLPGETCIGELKGQGCKVTKFADGISEKLVMLNNGQVVIAHKDGRYIPLNDNDVVMGFEGKFYSMINGNVFPGSTDPPVIYDGRAISIKPDEGELICKHKGETIILSINGDVRKLPMGKTVSGFFDTAYEAHNNGDVSLHPIEEHEPLEISVEKLSLARTPSQARACLTELFESVNGTKLFTDNKYPVTKEDTLAFIKKYRKAIILECKWKIPQSSNNKADKIAKIKQRILAIDEVRNFVKGLNTTDKKLEDNCRHSLQMLGRIRERSLVRQRDTPLCGGFAVLQAAWGKYPLKMVSTSLKLLRSKERSVQLDTRVPGFKKTIVVPQNYQPYKYHEAACDSMLIASLYDISSTEGSSNAENAMNASYLGIPVLLTKNINKNSDRPDEFYNNLLNDLCRATKRKMPILGVVDGKMAKFLADCLPKKFLRKNSAGINNIENKFSKFNGSTTGHSIIIDKVERKWLDGQKVVNLKLHTWGIMHHLQMNEDTFLQNFVFDKNLGLVNTNNSLDFNSFEKLDDTIYYIKGNEGIVECADGKKYHLKIGESVTVDGCCYIFEGDRFMLQTFIR